jgi:predicted metal-dependent peptidase
MTNQEISQQLIFAARGRLLQENPFFGGLALELTLRPDPGFGGIGVNMHGVIKYEPNWIVDLVKQNGGASGAGRGLNVLQTILAHEVLHPALGHCVDSLDIADKDLNKIKLHQLHNIACDIVINSWLKGADMPFPTSFARPIFGSDFGICSKDEDHTVHENFSSMEIYLRLLREAQQVADSQSQPGDGSGDGDECSGLGNAIADMIAQAEGTGAGLASDISDEEGENPKGSGSGDDMKDKMDQHSAMQQPGEFGEEGQETGSAPGKQERREQSKEDWRNKLTTAAATATLSDPGQGSMPAWLKRRIGFQEDVKHSVPWERTLQQAVASENARSFARPSRRHSWRGQLLPGTVPHIRKAVVIVDTSGSVGQRELKVFSDAIAGLQRTNMVKVLATIACDAAVTNVTKGAPKPGQEKFYGGGGTDFRPALAEAKKFRPDVTIYLTDGWGYNFENKPQGLGTMVWVLTPYGDPQKWGTNVEINYHRGR